MKTSHERLNEPSRRATTQSGEAGRCAYLLQIGQQQAHSFGLQGEAMREHSRAFLEQTLQASGERLQSLASR